MGCKKPVGVLAVDADIYIADQDIKQIWKAPIANPTAFTVFASIDDGLDTPALGPDNSIFVGSTSGKVYRISAAPPPTVKHTGSIFFQ